jgi:hypothetical protein
VQGDGFVNDGLRAEKQDPQLFAFARHIASNGSEYGFQLSML